MSTVQYWVHIAFFAPFSEPIYLLMTTHWGAINERFGAYYVGRTE